MGLVVFVDEVDDYFYHGVLFFGAAFGYHQSESDEGIVGDAFGAVFIVKDAVAIEKPKEECGGNAFVAVAEGVILGNKIQKHGGFFLDRGVEVDAAESLVDLADGTFERIVFLVAEQCTASELLMQFTDDFHSVFVGGMECHLRKRYGSHP